MLPGCPNQYVTRRIINHDGLTKPEDASVVRRRAISKRELHHHGPPVSIGGPPGRTDQVYHGVVG